MTSNDIAIDFGTSNIRIYTKTDGLVVDEPSVVAIDTVSQKIIAVGHSANDMIGRTGSKVLIVKPIERGRISNITVAKYILKQFLNKVNKSNIMLPRILVSIPDNLTKLELKALIEVVQSCKIKDLYFIYQSLAAVIGSGADLSLPRGRMIVDIGAGTTEIALVSLNRIHHQASINVAGDIFDKCIVDYVRYNYNLAIGKATATYIKHHIACVAPINNILYCKVKGRNMLDSLPQTIRLNSNELMASLQTPVRQISTKVRDVLKCASPEMISDISEDGILLTGGSAMLKGLFVLLSRETKLKIKIAAPPDSCVIVGAGRSLKYLDDMSNKANNCFVNIKTY